MTLNEIKIFLQRLQNDDSLESQIGIPEYSKFTNFYLSYREALPNLEQVFVQICEEVTKLESSKAHAAGKRANKRSAQSQARFLTCVRVLALNVFQAQTKLIADYLNLAISLNNNSYGLNKRYAPSFVSYRPLVAAFYGMVKTGYLVIHRNGYRDPAGGGEMTRYRGTQKLFKAMENIVGENNLTFCSVYREREDETIILRDKQKHYAPYIDNPETASMRDKLSRINTILSSHTYSLNLPTDKKDELVRQMRLKHLEDPDFNMPYIDFTAIRLYRIFSEENFERGGRFYRGWWQNIPSDFRHFITIDGEPTVELDYSALHPHMLYAQAGLTLDREPYAIHPDIHRNAGKVAFNALLNAHTMPLRAEPESYFKPDGITWEQFLKKMILHHEPVAHLFTEGYGLTLQYTDSILAESILLHFVEQDIPCLPIHDSFIVPLKHQMELKDVMEKKSYEKYGVSIPIK